mgnify:CR=1 FL=1
MDIKEKIKLCLLIDVLEDIKGGAEKQIYELIKRIDKTKFKIYLFILHQKKIPYVIQKLLYENDTQIEVKGIGIKRIYDWKGVYEGFKFIKFLKEKKIDILITYHFASDIWGTVFGRLANVSIIISNRRDAGFWRNKFHILAYRMVNRWVKKIVVVSKAVEKMVIEEEGVCRRKIELIYNGVDLEKFEIDVDIFSKKRELGIPSKSKVVGCVGNLTPVKGHKFLIEAASQIIKKNPYVHFLFIGDGPLKRNLISLTSQLYLQNNIHFLGKRNDVNELLKIMDVCVLPSLSEGLSNALLEYMASGKPVIATEVGGNTEVIEHGVNGILVPPNDSKSLEEEILYLLTNEEFARMLGKRARETVEKKFNMEEQVRYTENFLFNLLKKEEQKKEIGVLHLISSNGLFGAEKVMLSLAKRINCNRIKPYIVSVNNYYNPHFEVVKKAQENNLPVFVVDSKRKFDLRTIRDLCNIIKINRIDLIHTHNYKANFLGFIVSKKLKLPIVTTLHGYIGDGLRLKFYESLDRFLLRFFNKVILVDECLKENCSKNLNYTIIHNGIEIDDSMLHIRPSHEIRKELGVATDKTIIGAVGRLSKEKGISYLLKAFAVLVKRNHNLQLLIVGEGPLRDNLEKLCKELNIKKDVIFTGFQEEVDKYYSVMDIYVCSSLIEHFPLSVMEAMKHGLAVIATNVGGTPKLIRDNSTGLLIKPYSTKEIYDSLKILIEDNSLRTRLGEEGRRFIIENFSIDGMVKRYEKIYEEVIRM